jgi:hypothetical protein
VAKEEKAQPFDQAWEALKADPSVQFNLAPVPPDPKSPPWIEALGRFLERLLSPIGDFLQWLFSWLPGPPAIRGILGVILGAAVLLLLWLLFDRLRRGQWTLPEGQIKQSAEEEAAWRPDEAPVRSWLEEADMLAREGRFAEAVHCLLRRSVEDMARRWPDAVSPGLTSRELARSSLLSERARPLFTGLAALVEQSFFGGASVSETGWREARNAYGSFALPETWRA